ncbi:hypothetical protein Zmor_009818 [Zophobas morio]|uniref:Uncharacterized protein n=1 Tax=Zophobas morio TaxID=2755281 RepID=A0AA38IJK2_9CUCU|nr:hypothetical protein Zmor_009818 [Zophobas morio]
MPKPLHKDAKQMVSNLVDYFAKERYNEGPLLPLTAVRRVNSVVQQIKTGEGVRFPKKKRTRKKPVCDISTLEQCAI